MIVSVESKKRLEFDLSAPLLLKTSKHSLFSVREDEDGELEVVHLESGVKKIVHSSAISVREHLETELRLAQEEAECLRKDRAEWCKTAERVEKEKMELKEYVRKLELQSEQCRCWETTLDRDTPDPRVTIANQYVTRDELVSLLLNYSPVKHDETMQRLANYCGKMILDLNRKDKDRFTPQKEPPALEPQLPELVVTQLELKNLPGILKCAGLAKSVQHAEELIKNGLVVFNGRLARNPDIQIAHGEHMVSVEGRTQTVTVRSDD